jgi:hypothetical protein
MKDQHICLAYERSSYPKIFPIQRSFKKQKKFQVKVWDYLERIFKSLFEFIGCALAGPELFLTLFHTSTTMF